MNELSLKLKESVIKYLNAHNHVIDEPYIYREGKTYTRREIISEIDNETPFGVGFLSSMIMLAIDLTSRDKIK